MNTKSMLKFYAALMILTGFAACQYTDRSGNAQLDSAPVGHDSLRRLTVHTRPVMRPI